MSLLDQQRYESRKRLAQIARKASSASGINRAPLDLLIDYFLHSPGVQALARYEGWSHRFEGRVAELLWRQLQCSSRAARLGDLSPCTISYSLKSKKDGGHRKTCKLTGDLWMWHILAKKLLHTLHEPRPHIGDCLGRGRDYQIKLIADAISDAEQHIVVADIRSAFSSVDREALYRLLPLPNELVARALDGRRHRFVLSGRSSHGRIASSHDGDDETDPVSGILEGSPASNAIFSLLMDDLPDHFREGIRTFLYCDNIILIAPGRDRALEAINTLAEHLAGHPAGPFYLRSNSYIASATEGFDHLGYRIAYVRQAGEAVVDLSDANWCSLQRRNEQNGRADALRWLGAHFRCCTLPAAMNARLCLSR